MTDSDASLLLSTIEIGLSQSNTLLKDLKLLPTDKGISLLSLKLHLFLSYLHNLALLILVKIHGESISEGKYGFIVERLVELRIIIEKGIQPIESKLKYQIDKILDNLKKHELSKKHKIEDTENGLLYKPNPMDLLPVDNDNDKSDSVKKGIYHPPRISSALPFESVEQRLPLNHTLRDFIASEMSSAPVSEPSIGSNIVSHGKRFHATSTDEQRNIQKRRDYEEENFVRLPSKKYKRKEQNVFGGEDWRILDNELYYPDFSPDESLVSKSRQEMEDEEDAPIVRRFGVDFNKKKKSLMKKLRLKAKKHKISNKTKG
ncbi:hypothetical protein T552_02888 [Pneumocystis carinii B80]|uniref:Uncharacterized protein n=1 Tax=Pneumocystis carinii (strain B80) TaxID=1408658 RepID=A0A0W4ZDL4_PNEC8|nr:hypothetical protein T552_02888 [Pneumocystis carinii B80]KTW26407.1 hypothetical protein T552_02888 [Pneumocystis carinii B80]